MKWRGGLRGGRFGTFRSAFDTIIVSHNINEKKIIFHRFHFTSSDCSINNFTGLNVGTLPGKIINSEYVPQVENTV